MWHRKGCGVMIAGGLAVLLLGCVTTEQMAPPVGPALVEFAGSRSIEAGALARGRRVYLSECSTCHSIEPIERYSLSKWKMIAPEMAEESRLDDGERADLFAYLYTVRKFMDVAPANGPDATQYNSP